MQYDDWMRRTRAGAMHPRSAALRNLDKALRAHGTTLSQQSFNGLKTAFETWQRGSESWENSIRNADGAVTELAAYIARGWPPPPKPPAPPTVLAKGGGGGGNAFSEAAALALRRRQLAEKQEFMFRRDVTQTLTYRPGDSYNHWTGTAWEVRQYTRATPQTFSWKVVLGYLNRGPVIEVKVRLNLRLSNGVNMPAQTQHDFKVAFQSFWNCATIKDNGSKREVLFSIEFEDGTDAYTVDIANPPPIPKGLSRQEVARLQDQNTIHKEEWAWSDRVAILHEFGHLIGNPDEYRTTSFTGMPLTWSADTYDQEAYTTKNIMNKPDETAMVAERNFAMVLEGYKAWQRHLGADPVGATISIERARLPQSTVTVAEAMNTRRLAMGYVD